MVEEFSINVLWSVTSNIILDRDLVGNLINSQYMEPFNLEFNHCHNFVN
jgi:hypothetical protein